MWSSTGRAKGRGCEVNKIISLLMLVIMMMVLFCVGAVAVDQHNSKIKMEQEIASLRYELKQTQEQCKRMTDTCVDILANKRWE